MKPPAQLISKTINRFGMKGTIIRAGLEITRVVTSCRFLPILWTSWPPTIKARANRMPPMRPMRATEARDRPNCSLKKVAE